MTPMQTCRIGDEICLPDSSLPRVVVIGGGFAGISLVKKLKNKPVQVVVLDKNNFHQFQPLLYQVALNPIVLSFRSENYLTGTRMFFFGWQ